MHCNKSNAELLIARGGDVNAKDNDGATPAYIATTLAIMFDKQQVVEMVNLLVAKGAQVDIHLAAFIGDVEKVNDFLEQGIDINAKAKSGETPVCMAALTGQKEMVKFLISKGADVNAKAGLSTKATSVVYSPLHSALIYPDYEVVKLLIDNGADIKAKGFLGPTLLVPLIAAETRGAKVFEEDSGLDIGFSHEEFDLAMQQTVEARAAE